MCCLFFVADFGVLRTQSYQPVTSVKKSGKRKAENLLSAHFTGSINHTSDHFTGHFTCQIHSPQPIGHPCPATVFSSLGKYQLLFIKVRLTFERGLRVQTSFRFFTFRCIIHVKMLFRFLRSNKDVHVKTWLEVLAIIIQWY